MQHEIRMTLFIIGVVIIGGVLLHGLWTIRKSKKKPTNNASFESKNWEPDLSHEDDINADGPIYDDVGVGKARIVVSAKQAEVVSDDFSDDQVESSELEDDITDPQDVIEADEIYQQIKANEANVSVTSLDEELDDSAPIESLDSDVVVAANDETPIDTEADTDNDATPTTPELPQQPMYSNVVTQPKPGFNRLNPKESKEHDVGQPPEFLLKKDEQNDESEQNNALNTLDSEKSSVDGSENRETLDSSHVEPIIPETPDFSLDMQDAAQSIEKPNKKSKSKGLSFAEQAKRLVRSSKKSSEASKSSSKRKEPSLSAAKDDQLNMNFSDEKPGNPAGQMSLVEDEPRKASKAKKKYTGEPEVLILNVKVDKTRNIDGAALLPMLLTLGFKFGEHDIFHRHVNSNGKGPILFSLTNMLKPGVFDIDNMENFSTVGLSLFMMLPSESDAQQVFNMMHNAARKIADEFGGKVLDANKVPLSKQSTQQYVEKIRAFDRKLNLMN